MDQRNTRQKDIILAALTALGNHPTADAVYDRVHADYPRISRATVFRVLNQMADNGRICKVSMFDGADCYDHNIMPHCHARCTRCHRVFDIFCEKPPVSSFSVPEDDDFEITDYSLQFEGLCRSCRKLAKEKT